VVDQTPAAPSSTPAGAPAPAGIELLPVTTAGSADSPDAGSDDPAGDARPSVRLQADPAPTTDTDAVVAVPGQAPVTPAATVAPAAAPPPAGGGPPVAAQLGRQLAVLRHAPDGSQTMTVVITPENLGQVTVAVTITDGTLDLTLHGAHETGRHALAEALPELRRELESAGLSFAKLEVSTSGGDAGTGLRNAQQQLDARAGQQGSGQPGQQDPRPRTWGAAPDRLGEGGTARATDPSTSPGVDVLA
jgi:flagellar hook-length control protein FliK